ncbi:hypothetical protein E0W68_09600 [Flavobacterium salilacus subsp. salilacus]|uniref:hypothetical protein n=1 Tax=Flavobacterium TaxID=237 RepID=UPI0010752077|nr:MULTISPECIES: hypothetical protein [Flavobacterium]KAF2518269.1 hypothetical protein E0W68_09600 [Flavobacterium salilacus subsp. salilacus]MBE1615321.1 hypothetical protein [Flavobacterium sp. SaA2.13]
MKDLIKDILETSRDRIKTPITGSFALAFLLWNWRPLLILLFSDSSIEDKIKHIDKNYCTTWALLVPLMIALFYITLVPYIMVYLEFFTKRAIKVRKMHKAELTISDLDNNIEFAKKQFELEQAKNGYKEISTLNNRIANLELDLKIQNDQHKKQINTLNDQHKSQAETYEKIIEGYKENKEIDNTLIRNLSTLSDDHKKTIELLSKQILQGFSENEKKGFIDFCDFYIYKNISKYKRYETFDLFEDELINRSLIAKGSDGYSITPLGEILYYYLKENEPIL